MNNKNTAKILDKKSALLPKALKLGAKTLATKMLAQLLPAMALLVLKDRARLLKMAVELH